MKKKIIIDTDIGDDIDDAIALFAAMRQEFDILGITTVFRNTIERARIAKKLLTLYANGYETVPVYAGYGDPYGMPATEYGHTPHYTQDLIDYIPDSTDPENAVDFIIEACHTYGKDLTVIAVGPFTNIARVVEKDPTALNKACNVAIMGGAYLRQFADWNVICDTIAADIMYRNVDNLLCIGADVTHQMMAEGALYNALLHYDGENAAHRYLQTMCAMWRTDHPEAPLLLHDPLVIYFAADPALCTMQEASIVMITEGYAKGLTLNVGTYHKKHVNPAFDGFDATRKTKFAALADKEIFLSRICRDFTA